MDDGGGLKERGNWDKDKNERGIWKLIFINIKINGRKYEMELGKDEKIENNWKKKWRVMKKWIKVIKIKSMRLKKKGIE